jgi:hypothetical protein
MSGHFRQHFCSECGLCICDCRDCTSLGLCCCDGCPCAGSDNTAIASGEHTCSCPSTLALPEVAE